MERARELATYLLTSPTAPWNLQMIGGAIAAGNTRRVPLHEPFPVYLLYWTAFADANDTVQFRDDIYGRDRRLAAALVEPIIREVVESEVAGSRSSGAS